MLSWDSCVQGAMPQSHPGSPTLSWIIDTFPQETESAPAWLAELNGIWQNGWADLLKLSSHVWHNKSSSQKRSLSNESYSHGKLEE